MEPARPQGAGAELRADYGLKRAEKARKTRKEKGRAPRKMPRLFGGVAARTRQAAARKPPQGRGGKGLASRRQMSPPRLSCVASA